jgi:hypothetical protein
MSRFFHLIAFGAVMLLAPGLLFSQGGGAGTVGGSFSSSMSSSGSGGSVSRNFRSLTRESALRVLLFRGFSGMKAAPLTRIEHTTAKALVGRCQIGAAR